MEVAVNEEGDHDYAGVFDEIERQDAEKKIGPAQRGDVFVR